MIRALQKSIMSSVAIVEADFCLIKLKNSYEKENYIFNKIERRREKNNIFFYFCKMDEDKQRRKERR